jgi:hypothetical protein
MHDQLEYAVVVRFFPPLPGWFGEVIEVWEDGRLGELLCATRFQHTAEDAAAEAWRWIKDNT